VVVELLTFLCAVCCLGVSVKAYAVVLKWSNMAGWVFLSKRTEWRMSVQSGIAGVDMEKAESVRGSEYVEPFKAWKWELSGALIVGFHIPGRQSLE
jgi:hypothetical protein